MNNAVRLDGADSHDLSRRHMTTVEKPVARLRSVPTLVKDVAPWSRDAAMEVVNSALGHVEVVS